MDMLNDARQRRFVRLALSCCLAGLLLCGLTARAQTRAVLSLNEALALAERNAPALNAVTHGVQAAREMAVAAGQLPDPVLRAGVENLPVAGADRWNLTRDFMTMRRVGVMQEFVSTDKRELLRRRAELDAVRQQASQLRLTSSLRQDVANAWFERYYAGQSRTLLNSLAKEVELQLRTLYAQIRAGKASASDASMASAALLQVEDRLLVTRRQEELARITLQRWLGDDALRDPADLPDIESLTLNPADAAVLASVPALREHETESEIARADLAVTQSNSSPNWSWELAYSLRGPGFPNMVSFGVSIPLTVRAADRQDREVAAKMAQLEQAHAQHEDMRRDTQAAMSGALAEWKSLLERRTRLATALLPVARQRIDLTLASYRAGPGSLAAVLEARRAEVEVRMQLLDLERDTAKLWAQLQYLYAGPAANRVQGALP